MYITHYIYSWGMDRNKRLELINVPKTNSVEGCLFISVHKRTLCRTATCVIGVANHNSFAVHLDYTGYGFSFWILIVNKTLHIYRRFFVVNVCCKYYKFLIDYLLLQINLYFIFVVVLFFNIVNNCISFVTFLLLYGFLRCINCLSLIWFFLDKIYPSVWHQKRNGLSRWRRVIYSMKWLDHFMNWMKLTCSVKTTCMSRIVCFSIIKDEKRHHKSDRYDLCLIWDMR